MPRTTKPGAPDISPAWGEELLRIPPAQIERREIVARPYPPDECAEDRPVTFVPDSRFAAWIRETFVAGSGPLANEEHEHLLDARIGVLWTNAIHQRQQRLILATAEIPTPMVGGWRRARQEVQLSEWFDGEPLDFLLTFSASDCARLDDRAFCALVEHELLHCAQALDGNGFAKFSRDGAPIYAIRGHDVEEFTSVVRRYGPTSPDVQEMVDAANSTPLIAGAPIALACGTVARAAA